MRSSGVGEGASSWAGGRPTTIGPASSSSRRPLPVRETLLRRGSRWAKSSADLGDSVETTGFPRSEQFAGPGTF